MGRVLLHDGFIRTITAEEGMYNRRITTKGLALFSLLDSLYCREEEALKLEELSKTNPGIVQRIRQEQAAKVLAALMGTACSATTVACHLLCD